MTLLTYQQAAERLTISVSHVRALARAAELAGGYTPLEFSGPERVRWNDRLSVFFGARN